MRKIESSVMCSLHGGGKSDVRAGFVCGAAIGASIVVGIASGGVGMIAMLGGAALPACGISIAGLY